MSKKTRRIPQVIHETCPKCGARKPSERSGFYLCDTCKKPPEGKKAPESSRQCPETGPNLSSGDTLLTAMPLSVGKD